MDKLLKQLADIDAQADAILASETFTEEQRAELDALEKQRSQVEEKIELQKRADERARQRVALQSEADAKRRRDEIEGRKTATAKITDAAEAAGVEIGNLSAAQPKDMKKIMQFGYTDFGQFALDVRRAAITKKTPERFLAGFDVAQQAVATGMGEAVGSDGGFLVPPEFSSKIFSRMYDSESLLARTDIYTIMRNSIIFPRIDETSRANGSRAGGVQAYWVGEGDSATATKPKIGRLALNLHKLMAFGRATDELLEDSTEALDTFLTKHFGDEINFLVNNSLVNGTGAGMPMGILNAACTVSVSKETGQSAATVNATNILKMWSRLWGRSRLNSLWLINQDVEPQLYSMQIGTGVANQVVYMPPGGLSANPYATLMGRPVLTTEFNATLGTVGDIILVDLSQWVTAVKGAGPQSAVSMHLYFDTDEMAFRTTYRLDSQPWWSSALTPFKGTNTQSCAVTLATRS